MTTVKTVATNYSADQVTAIVTAYKNGDSLETIAASVGKSVPSVRAKLSQLKVYISKAKQETKTSDKGEKANKEDLSAKLSELVGLPLLNVEASSKAALLALINHINGLNTKIDGLVSDLLGDESESDEASDSSDV